MNKGKQFDYESINPGYYDIIFRKNSGVQSKWHHLKFFHVQKEIVAPCRHLDIGCGPGTFIGTLSEGIISYGVDISKKQIEYANKHYQNEYKSFQQIFVGREFPFEDNSFDVVTIIEVIEHLRKDQALSLLDQSYRMLRPGGKIIITTPNYKSFWPLLEVLLNSCGQISYQDQHINRYCKRSLYNQMLESGFKSVKINCFQSVAPFFAAINWQLSDRVYRVEQDFKQAFLGMLLLAKGEKPYES